MKSLDNEFRKRLRWGKVGDTKFLNTDTNKLKTDSYLVADY